MIWHIFKKDWKLLWPLVVGLAVGRLLAAALSIELGPFNEPPELLVLAVVLQLALDLGIVAVIVAAVHQDALPGDRQDWLTRPIRRRDLLLAKLLFVVIAVQGPVVVANLVAAAVEGLALGDTLVAAFTNPALLFCFVLFGMAAMTRTVTEVIAGAVAIVIVVLAAGMAARAFVPPVPFANSGLAWMELVSYAALGLAAALLIVPLQYLCRATAHARGVALVAIVLAIGFAFTRWPEAYALQQWLAPNQALAQPVTLFYAPDFGKSSKQPGLPFANSASVQLPIHISGLPPDSFVKNDHAEIRIVAHDGATLYRANIAAPPTAYATDLSPVQTTDLGDVFTYQQIALPVSTLDRLRDRTVRMEIDYYLTLYQLGASQTIAAVNGEARLRAFGGCESRIDSDGDEIEIGCLKTGAAPSCIKAILEIPSRQLRNPDGGFCHRDYAPAYFVLNSAIVPFTAGVRFRDPQGLAKFPVDGAHLADAEILMKSYRPVAHFTRHLTIPKVRLADLAWAPPTQSPTDEPAP